jgi:hypothetical protein
MHARLSPARGGCQLLGAFAWHPFARVFSALWLGLSGCFVLIGLAMTVASAVAGRWSFASSALAFTGVTAGIAALAVVLIQVAVRLGERDEQFLRTWLAERLESRGDRQPGHGPREPDAP